MAAFLDHCLVGALLGACSVLSWSVCSSGSVAGIALTVSFWSIFFLHSIRTFYPLLSAHLSGLTLPPGDMGFPYWGESLEYLASWNNNVNPDVWYDIRRAKHGNVFKTHILGSATVVMLGPDANKFILTNENKLFENSWPISVQVLEGSKAVSVVQGEEHRRIRRALMMFLGKEALKSFVGRIEDVIVAHLAAHWQAGHVLEAFPDIKQLTFNVAANLFMSLRPGESLQAFKKHYHTFTSGLMSQPLDLPWTVFGKAKRARDVLLECIFREIKERRKAMAMDVQGEPKPKDLLDLLMLAKDEDTGSQYSDEEIGQNLLVLLHAGHDTTSSALMIIIKNLALYPNILKRLRSECMEVAQSKKPGDSLKMEEVNKIQLLKNVIHEGLRICVPVNGAFKRAKTDITYCGYTIPKGWKVHYSIRQTHNKPEFFPEPKKFDPTRFEARTNSYTFLPFGQGTRICPGNEFGMLVMQVFLYHVVTRFDWELVDPEEGINMYFFPTPKKGLPVALKTAAV